MEVAAAGLAELSGISVATPATPAAAPTTTTTTTTPTTHTALVASAEAAFGVLRTTLSPALLASATPGAQAHAAALLARVSPSFGPSAALCAFVAAAARPFAPPPAGLPLTSATALAGLPLAALWDPLRAFAGAARLGAAAEQRLLLAQKTFVVLSLLREKYGRMLASALLRPPSADADAASASDDAAASDAEFARLGWLLFVLVRAAAAPAAPDLAPALSLAVCCVHFVCCNCAADRLRCPAGSYSLEWLCRACDVPHTDAREALSAAFEPFLQSLRREGALVYRSCDAECDPARDAATGIDEQQLRENVERCDVLYERQLARSGDFDERVFGDPERAGSLSALPQHAQAFWNIRVPKQRSAVPLTPVAKKRPTLLTLNSPLVTSAALTATAAAAGRGRSPAPTTPSALSRTGGGSSVPATPMRAAFATISWLTLVENYPMGPSTAFVARLNAARLSSVANTLQRKVSDMLSSVSFTDVLSLPISVATGAPKTRDVVPSSALVAFTSESAEKRAATCKRTFWHLLEALVTRQASLLQGKEASDAMLSALLSRDEFIRSLLAISAELVAFASKLVTLAFPRTMAAFDVTPLEYFRIVGNVLALDERFPSDFVTHLRSVEESLMDNLCWAHGSRLYDLLATCAPAQIRAIAYNVAPSPGSVALFPPSVPASDATPAQVPVPKSLHAFLRKMFIMCAKKLQDLAADVSDQHLLNQMWDLLVFVVTERAESLLKNRHVSLVLLCIVHAVLTAHERPSSFRTLISQNRVPNEVWQQVVLSSADATGENQQTGDVVGFYNEVFVPAVTDFIGKAKEHYSTLAKPHPTTSAASAATPAKPVPATPERRGTVRFVVCSPMRGIEATPMRGAMPLLSPRFKFGQSPLKDLKHMNEAIATASGGVRCRGSTGFHMRPPPAKFDLTALLQRVGREEKSVAPPTVPADGTEPSPKRPRPSEDDKSA